MKGSALHGELINFVDFPSFKRTCKISSAYLNEDVTDITGTMRRVYVTAAVFDKYNSLANQTKNSIADEIVILIDSIGEKEIHSRWKARYNCEVKTCTKASHIQFYNEPKIFVNQELIDKVDNLLKPSPWRKLSTQWDGHIKRCKQMYRWRCEIATIKCYFRWLSATGWWSP